VALEPETQVPGRAGEKREISEAWRGGEGSDEVLAREANEIDNKRMVEGFLQNQQANVMSPSQLQVLGDEDEYDSSRDLERPGKLKQGPR